MEPRSVAGVAECARHGSRAARDAVSTQRAPAARVHDFTGTSPDRKNSSRASHPLSGDTQTVEIRRGRFMPGQSVELRLELVRPPVRAGDAIPFPAFAVTGATEREEDGLNASPRASQWTLRPREPGLVLRPGGLWGWLTTDSPDNADALYLFRGRNPKARRHSPMRSRSSPPMRTCGSTRSAVRGSSPRRRFTLKGGRR